MLEYASQPDAKRRHKTSASVFFGAGILIAFLLLGLIDAAINGADDQVLCSFFGLCCIAAFGAALFGISHTIRTAITQDRREYRQLPALLAGFVAVFIAVLLTYLMTLVVHSTYTAPVTFVGTGIAASVAAPWVPLLRNADCG